MEFKRTVEADMRSLDQRVGPEARQSAIRPWAAKPPGSRAEDVLRHDLAEARRALTDAEARLEEIAAACGQRYGGDGLEGAVVAT